MRFVMGPKCAIALCAAPRKGDGEGLRTSRSPWLTPRAPASCALALATVTVRAAPFAQSVPTLIEMALLLLAAWLGLSAVLVHRRGG